MVVICDCFNTNALYPHVILQLSGSVLKRLGRFETGTHNETWQCMGYYDCIAHFLKEVSEAFSGSELP